MAGHNVSMVAPGSLIRERQDQVSVVTCHQSLSLGTSHADLTSAHFTSIATELGWSVWVKARIQPGSGSANSPSPWRRAEISRLGDSRGTWRWSTPSFKAARQVRSLPTTYFLRSSSKDLYQTSILFVPSFVSSFVSAASCQFNFDRSKVAGSCGSGIDAIG